MSGHNRKGEDIINTEILRTLKGLQDTERKDQKGLTERIGVFLVPIGLVIGIYVEFQARLVIVEQNIISHKAESSRMATDIKKDILLNASVISKGQDRTVSLSNELNSNMKELMEIMVTIQADIASVVAIQAQALKSVKVRVTRLEDGK